MSYSRDSDEERLRRSPDLKDVEPGGDADETPAQPKETSRAKESDGDQDEQER